MSYRDAVTDAHQRIAVLKLPDGELPGITITLPVYEDEAVFAFAGGRGSIVFNDMVNTAMSRILRKRKATVTRRVVTIGDFVQLAP